MIPVHRVARACVAAAWFAAPGGGVGFATAKERPAGGVAAREDAGASAAAQANNPLANFTVFDIHDYYIPELTDQDADANQLWLRFAKPFSIARTSWILRASLPINSFPAGPSLEHETGIGDVNAFAAYLIDVGHPAVSFGVGPQLTAPTASELALGSEKWSAGIVNVLFDARSRRVQYGYLATWQASFAGEDDRDDVNLGSFQPFLFYQLGGGTYLRSTGIWAYDFESSTYTLPIGLGVGQVLPTEQAIFNVFVEPQVSVLDEGAGWAEWQVFVGFNTQFK